MRVYCTLFDKNYLSRGLALQRSLMSCCPDSTLVILGLDQVTVDVLSALNLPGVELISLQTLESGDTELARVRPQRSAVEFYCTCKPVLMRYALAKFPTAPRITYLDADLYFFADPAPVEVECAHSAIALSPHRFPPRLQDRVLYGQFNAGWVSVDSSAEGRQFVGWWRSRCIEWCLLEIQGERFADQKYLDQVPRLFNGVCAVTHPGANAAPWNLDGLRIEAYDNSLTVNGKPLLFFHFHGVQRVLYHLYDCGLYGYGTSLTSEVRKYVFLPYLAALDLAERMLSSLPDATRKDLKRSTSISGLRQLLARIRYAGRLIAAGAAVVGP